MKRFNWLCLLLAVLAMPALAFYPTVGPGLHKAEFLAGQTIHAGYVDVYNSQLDLNIDVVMEDGWLISEIQIHVGVEPPYSTKKGTAVPGKYPYKAEYETPVAAHSLTLGFHDEYPFAWGKPYEDLRFPYVAIHADVVKLDDEGNVIAAEGAWLFGEPFEGDQWGWQVQYELAHPKIGHFRDSPVSGARMASPTFKGRTGDSGEFTYFPGESAEFYIGKVKLGDAVLDHRVTPLDFFAVADSSDPRVINMARLLQSLDADGAPKAGITITPEVEVCLEAVVEDAGIEALDFTDDALIDAVITDTLIACADVEGLSLVSVSAEDAKINLDRSLNSNMFRKNVSKTESLPSTKAKLNVMGVWFPALKANGDPAVFTDEVGNEVTGVPYYDAEGNLVRVADNAKPLIITYTDEEEVTGAADTWGAVSRDDGSTWKRANLSRSGDRSSFVLETGEDYYGTTKKPVFQVKGNKILVAWSSKFCKGGKPTYAISTCDDPATEEVEAADPDTGLCRITCHGDGDNEVCEPDYPYDDPYYTEDIWGVGGPQLSHDYTEDGYPEVGEIPYSCVWTARGTVVTQGMIDKGGFWDSKEVGDVVWYKPERLTSGRRDALQIFMGGADGAGIAVAWQEDPEGLRPGQFKGPGHGWSGATVNHKTDIWYSFITWSDFDKVDTHFVAGGDPEHNVDDWVGRPKALVPMSLPVRISDNDVLNTDNLMVELGGDGLPIVGTDGNWIPTTNPDTDGDGTGTHNYGYLLDGLCEDFYTFINHQDEEKKVCITEDARLMDGDTGASRVNLFLQTYTKPDGTKSAWAIMNYEETKGAGAGAPDHEEDGGPYGDDYVIEEGKNVIYHSFDFQNPDLVSAGNIVNFPERDEDGNLVYLRDEEGNLIFDYLGEPQLAYENARRARFILQGKSAIGDSRTVMLVVYKQGMEGSGQPSDIMLRRVVAPSKGNPYAYSNFLPGAQNMSSVTPTETWVNPDQNEDAHGDGVKVVRWEQTPLNLYDSSSINPYEDARAHRGQIRGDLVTMGYSYTPNWAAARNGNDKYDFYIRRSFDGGQTWTTDPEGQGVEHYQIWTDYTSVEPTDPDADDPDSGGKPKIEEYSFFGPGEWEPTRNLSNLKNAKSSVIEPRIVCPPGTIKKDGVWTGIAEDKQNPNVCYVAYGTSTNPKKDPVTGLQEESVPMDLYYSFTQDKGETFVEVAWDVNPDASSDFAGETVYRWDYMAKGDPEQGEVQLRMTPDGSRFYGSWLEEGDDGSDIMFRRIMPPEYPANVATQ